MKFYSEDEAKQYTRQASNLMRGEVVYWRRGMHLPDLRVRRVRTRKYAGLLPYWTTQVYCCQEWQDEGKWYDLPSIAQLDPV